MNPSQILLEGVELMLIGMGSVFIFLILLIFCIRLMSFCVDRFVSAPAAPAPTPISSTAGTDLDADLLGAIQAAIHQHRARRV